MFELNSITFKDAETGKIVEVHISAGKTNDVHILDRIINSYEDLSKEEMDEMADCSLYAAILLGGGIKQLELYQNIISK